MVDKKIPELRLAAYAVITLTFWLVAISFFTSSWLASDRRFYGADFVKLGLWEACFRSFVSPHDLNMRRFYAGCRWVFTEEYQSIADVLEPPFFVTTQVFFTFGFISLLVACFLTLALQLCLPKSKDAMVARIIGILVLFAGICCTVAVIVFGALGHGREWMPQPDHNYLSWSFGLGVVGAFFCFVAAIIFFVESVQSSKRIRREVDQAYSLEQTHSKI